MASPGDIWRSRCGAVELRCGDWREVLADVERCDAVITDPPYGERTHEGQQHGRREARGYQTGNWCSTEGIPYAGWGPADVAAFVGNWSPRCHGWLCALTSHDLLPVYAEALAARGRYVFAPLPCVIRGMNVRLAGDGPSNWAVHLIVSRQRTNTKWGTLPGAYVGSREEQEIIGGKPLWLMRALVRDYSRPGDMIVDPCAGGATTLLAAAIEGRRAIGAEIDPATYELAVRRLSKGWTCNMLARAVAAPRQEALL